MSPESLFALWALGDTAAAAGHKDEARAAYQAAIVATNTLSSGVQADFVKDLNEVIKRL